MSHQEAQIQIAQILAALETQTGQLVDSLRVESVDITRMCDAVPQWQRHVVIVLKPIPGSHWSA